VRPACFPAQGSPGGFGSSALPVCVSRLVKRQGLARPCKTSTIICSVRAARRFYSNKEVPLRLGCTQALFLALPEGCREQCLGSGGVPCCVENLLADRGR